MIIQKFGLSVLLSVTLVSGAAIDVRSENQPSGDYSSSPPFYPTPEAKGLTPDWQDAIGKAKAFIQDLSLEQKVNLTTGTGMARDVCVGNIAPQPDIGFPGLCLQDGPSGARSVPGVSPMVASLSAASSWSRDLIRKRGEIMGMEAYANGVNVLLGPMMNMVRVARAGRNFESFGADPYLTGEFAYETIKGIQSQNVQACAKHYIGNEQETNRMNSSSDIDDRTLHEMYLPTFLRSVQAEVASLMCSYNEMNNSYACQNSYLMNGVLKTELAFDGYVMTDWFAHHSGVASAQAGLDMSMPGDDVIPTDFQGLGERDNAALPPLTSYWGANLTESVRNGSVEESRLDDMVTRILAGWYLLHQDDESFPEISFDTYEYNPNRGAKRFVKEHSWFARELGASSIILLKNEGALPLYKPKSLSVIGTAAAPGPYGANPKQYDIDSSLGVIALGSGSGAMYMPYLISSLESLQEQAKEDDTIIDYWLDNFDAENATKIAAITDASLVFISADSSESADRENLTSWYNGDELVKSVASVNNNTVVVVSSPGQLDLEAWIENPNVTAVVWASQLAHETGNAITDVLYGKVNPSGKLPFTIAKNLEDYGVDIVDNSEVPYSEGLMVDYRHFDAEGIEPRFEFGHGLSYTKFEYLGLNIEKIGSAQVKPASEDYGKSVRQELHQKSHQISATIENVGDRYGYEVAQLYLSFPETAGEPPKVLRGFERVGLEPGESKTVKFEISPYDTSIWDVVSQDWVSVLEQGETKVLVGASSRDIRLEGSL